MKALTIDTSVFISHLHTSDSNHNSSTEFFEQIHRDGFSIYVPILVFFEILQSHFNLSKSREQGTEIYEILTLWNKEGTLKIMNMDAYFLEYFVANYSLFSLKTSDCTIALVSHMLAIPLISWDKQFLKNVRPHVRSFTPSEFLKK